MCGFAVFSCMKHFTHFTPHRCTHPVATLHQSITQTTGMNTSKTSATIWGRNPNIRYRIWAFNSPKFQLGKVESLDARLQLIIPIAALGHVISGSCM
jgi:hypothetical protein